MTLASIKPRITESDWREQKRQAEMAKGAQVIRSRTLEGLLERWAKEIHEPEWHDRARQMVEWVRDGGLTVDVIRDYATIKDYVIIRRGDVKMGEDLTNFPSANLIANLWLAMEFVECDPTPQAYGDLPYNTVTGYGQPGNHGRNKK